MRGAAIGLVVMCLAVSNVRADTPAPTTATASPSEETVEIIDPGKGRKRAALILTFAGVALWGTSLAVTLVARNNYGKCAANGEILSDLSACPYDDPQGATDYAATQQRRARFWGTSLFLAGTAAFGTALFLRLTAPPKRRVVRVSATPVIAPDAVGFSFSGTF